MAIDFVSDRLAVGGLDDAQSAEARRQAGIEFVLSLTPEVGISGVRRAVLPVVDREPLPPEIIERAVDLIDAEVLAGRRVLVHCQMGISRSPAIAVCYLRQCAGLSVTKALGRIKGVRPQAMPHPKLLGSIVDYYDGSRAPADIHPLRGSLALGAA